MALSRRINCDWKEECWLGQEHLRARDEEWGKVARV
jgi:hypothetical protein